MVQSGRESRDPRHRDRRDRSHQDFSRSRERDKGRDRDRDRDRERDRDRDRGRGHDRERERRRDHRDGDFNREPPRPRFKDNEPRQSDSARNENYQQVYKIDFNNRPTLFDISPPGYETTPVSEYKHLKSIGALPVMAIPHGSTIILRARRLYVENLPEDLKPSDFIDFINNEIRTRNVAIKPGNPALALDLGLDRQTAYLEFRTAEEASAALIFDGIEYKGANIKITRPNDYQPASGYYFGCPHVFQDTLNKLFVACIPVHLTDDQVRELLCAFGELKAFNLVKDGATGLSKGYAFCEYRDGSVTDIAIAGLNNMPIADKKLVVQRAVLGSRAGTNLGGIIPTQMQVPGVDPDHIISHDLLVTEVLCLINTVTIEDLENPKELEEILEDVKEECAKYGEVVAVEIPPFVPDCPPPFIGRVFVQFADKDSCKEAHECLAGRKFKDRLILTTFYDLEKFTRKEF